MGFGKKYVLWILVFREIILQNLFWRVPFVPPEFVAGKSLDSQDK